MIFHPWRATGDSGQLFFLVNKKNDLRKKIMHQHKIIGTEDVERTRLAAIIKYKLAIERGKPDGELEKKYIDRHYFSDKSERNLGVFYARKLPEGSKVCVKRITNYIDRTSSDSSRIESHVISEAYILHTIITAHPNIVKLNQVLRDPAENAFWIEFEWIGDMNALYTSFDPMETWNLIHDVSSALAYCHSRGVAHCDVKLDNIMRRENRFVLIDFGSAFFVDNGVASPRYEVNPVGHRPPETLLSLCWNEKVDVWSLACSAVEFFCMSKREPHPFLYDSEASAGVHLLRVASLIGKIPAVMTMHVPDDVLMEIRAAGMDARGMCPGMLEVDEEMKRLVDKMTTALPHDRLSATAVMMNTTDRLVRLNKK